MPPEPTQIRLPFPDPPALTPAASREEPLIWVRRVVIWKDVAAPPIRDVKLKRGLNVVWSPVGRDPDAIAAGHASGKTLFCRLLRYCLGEEAFADPDDTASIRKTLPTGAIGAEVRVRGVTWAVRRAFSGRSDVAANMEDVTCLDADQTDGFDAFVNALQDTAFDRQRLALAPEPEGVRPWLFLLAWLTRDQECRIDSLTHWRHKDSSSHSPVRHASAETHLQLLRVVLDLYSARSHKLLNEVAKTQTPALAAESARKVIERRCGGLQDEVAAALNLDRDGVWPPPVELVQGEDAALAAHLTKLIAIADKRIREVAVVKVDRAYDDNVDQLAKAKGGLARLDQEIRDLEANNKHARQRTALLETDQDRRQAEFRESKHPTCPFDGAALDIEASKVACPLVRFPDQVSAKTVADETRTAWTEAKRELSEAERSVAAKSSEAAALRVRVRALMTKVEAQDAAAASRVAASQAAWASKGLVQRLFNLQEQLTQARDDEATAKVKLKTTQEAQTASLTNYSTSKLQTWFNVLVRRVLAAEAQGSVTLDGNGLHPRIEWRGRRRSVALNSLQVVLFDLAAMLCAVEGSSHAPAFLVHDSPREGDLDEWTYKRIFAAVLQLGPDEESAPFQYIITTTTNPPDGAARKHVCLELGSDTTERRLLQVDL